MMSFDSLPSAVATLQAELEVIKKLLQQLPSVNNQVEDEILTIEECAAFLHLQKPTVYAMVSQRRIPFLKVPGSKRLSFSKKDLTAWLKSSSHKTKEVVA